MQERPSYLLPHLAGTALLLSLTLAALAAPGDWPQFRGPNRDGVSAETGLLQELPPGGPPLVWKATGLGVGYSHRLRRRAIASTRSARIPIQFGRRLEYRRREKGLVRQARQTRRAGHPRF